jgi:hypothetical protein
MNAPDCPREPPATSPAVPQLTSRSIDWYAEGDCRVVEVAGVRIVVRMVGRKGRKVRISIEAPAGAVFASDSMVAGSE